MKIYNLTKAKNIDKIKRIGVKMRKLEEKWILDHVAVLVESIDQSLIRLKSLNLPVQEINEFPNEGTKEVYIGEPGQYGKLLLIEAISAGPYQRSFLERGKGLHHIAINVPSIPDLCLELKDSGWHLHLYSMESLNYKTIWLTRANNPILIEVHEVEDIAPNPEYFIQKMLLSQYISEKLITSLNISKLKQGHNTCNMIMIKENLYDIMRDI